MVMMTTVMEMITVMATTDDKIMPNYRGIGTIRYPDFFIQLIKESTACLLSFLDFCR